MRRSLASRWVWAGVLAVLAASCAAPGSLTQEEGEEPGGAGPTMPSGPTTPSGPATPPPALSDDLRAAIVRAMEGELPAVATCLVVAGEVAGCDAVGVTDVRTGRPATFDTPFLLASVTKVVTATAVMQLRDAGRVDLDQALPFPARHPGSGAPLTARALLTHTSGLADSDALDDFYSYGRDPALTLAEIVRGYLAPGGLYYAEDNFVGDGPGQVYEYCNMGYATLGYLVEVASGEDFRAYTQRHVLDALGMTRSYWRLADVPAGVELAVPHAPGDDGPEPVGLYTFADYPDGGLFASASDLAKLLVAVARDGDGLLAPATLAEMMTPQVPRLDADQGLAWYRDRFGERTWWAHDGAETGVAARLLFDPVTGDGLVLLANGEDEGDAFAGITELLIARLEHLAR